jgi:hypothetical protein
MKIKPEHYAYMKAEIGSISAELVAAHRRGLADLPKVKDVEKRLRWDLMHIRGLTPWVCANIYPYANDDHIDTALRSIMRELYGEKQCPAQ